MNERYNFRRIVSEKRMLLGVLGLLVIADLGLYVFAVYPLSLRVEANRQRANLASEQLKVVEQTLSDARIAMERKVSTDTALEEFYNELLPQALSGARVSTYPRLSMLATQSALVLERRSSSFVEDEASGLGRLQTTMLLAGQYQNIRKFIFELETSLEFIVIDEIVLSNGGSLESGLVLTLGLSTYYQIDSAA
jgi:hypothetical protein